jgi:hypothetical protein
VQKYLLIGSEYKAIDLYGREGNALRDSTTTEKATW